MTKNDRIKSNITPGSGARLVMAAAIQSWLTDEEWEAILETLPEIKVDVAGIEEIVAFGYRKLKDSRLSH